MRFADTELHPDLKAAVETIGFSELTPIQEQCLGPGLEGRDIAGISQTGTGKTVAFLLPIVQKIYSGYEPGAPIALIVTPTRELCLQIAEEARKLLANRPVEVCAVYGGEEYRKQEEVLARGPAIIAATPGRLIDYLKQDKIDMSALQLLVLDEADRMFDMGFIRDVRYIMRRTPPDAQTMLFSATLSYYVMRLAADFMKDPIEIRIESESVAVDRIDQHLLHLGRHEKDPYLVNQILAVSDIKAIVFSNYRGKVQHLERVLQRYGIAAVGISSLLDQKKRIRLLKEFKLGKYSVLVATDVASRGLDVDDITHVFNYDLPQDSESYVHRIGRTARAGKSGVSISYCSEEDYENLPRIQRYLGAKIPVDELNSDYLDFPEGEFERFEDAGDAGEADARDRDSGDQGEAPARDGEPRTGGKRRRRRGGRGRREGQPGDAPAAPAGERPPQAPRANAGGGMTVRDQDRAAVLGRTRGGGFERNNPEPARGGGNGRRGGGNGGNGGGRSGGGQRNRGRGAGRDREREREEEEQSYNRAGGEGGRRRRRRGGRGRRGDSRDREETRKPKKLGFFARILAFFKRK